MRSDPQEKRVYAWEWACESRLQPQLTAASAKRVIKWACEQYGVVTPKVQASYNNRGCSYYDPTKHIIRLVESHMTPFVCLHEAAHAIEMHYYGTGSARHGKQWLGIYKQLLLKSKLVSASGLNSSMRMMGLKASPPSRISAKALKQRAKK